MRRALTLLMLPMLAHVALAQEQAPTPPGASETVPDVAPADPALTLAVPAPETPADNPAQSISDQVFGPSVAADYAFGAFQRGYYLTALEYALPRAEQGDAAAQTLIAELYANGLGVPQDLEEAAGWYRLASNSGDILATFELATYYQSGMGVTEDRQRAAELFQRAADAGYAPAKYNMALLHIEGVHASPSFTTAAALMKEAADAELAEAQYDYGAMLLEGAGVAPNEPEGARYIALAAEQNLPEAQVDYATLLYLGRGVERDIAAAAEWYGRAAESGNAVAQNRFAKLLAAGEGVAEADLEQAAMWRALARRQGLTDPDLDAQLAAIAPDMLARAEERARFWPSPPPTAQTILEIPTATDAPTEPSLPAPTDASEAPAATAGEAAAQDP
jgi:TPR repeat protein